MAVKSDAENKYYYYTIPVVETMKGTKIDIVKFRIYLKQNLIDYIRLLPDNTKLIIFLTKLYAEFRNSDEDEFSNFIVSSNESRYDKGIVIYTDAAYREISNEIEYQKEILRSELYNNFKKNEAMAFKVKSLINELTNWEKAQNTIDEIIMMGQTAIPYIILCMDDYRELSIRHVRIKNDPPADWTGAWTHYGPNLIIDTAALILNVLTKGYNFGSIYSGYSIDEERQRALDGWRIYLYYINHGLSGLYQDDNR
jgi:hypothetical protein